MKSPALRALFACFVVCSSAGLIRADDAKAVPPAPSDAKRNDDAWRRIIYVPYRAIETVLKDPRGAAIVPLQDYLNYLRSADARPATPAAVVSETHYHAKVERDLIRIHASLTVQSVVKNWSEATVNFGDAAIGKLTSEMGRVLVRGSGRGTYSLLVPAAGTYKVEVELATRVRTSPDGRGFEFDCPTAGITTFELSIPESDVAVEIAPLPVFGPADSAKGETRIKAQLPATPRISARWHPRAGRKQEVELLASVRNRLAISIGDGVVHADAALAYTVFRGELRQIRLAVPKGDRILDVTSPQGALRSWRAQGEANRQLVIADLLSDATKDLAVEVHTERALPTEAFDVVGLDENGQAFGIHAVDAVRESGELVVSHRQGIDVAVESEKGLVRVDAADVRGESHRNDSLAFKFYSPSVRLRVDVRPVEPRVVVTHQSQVVLAEDELRLTANLKYDVTRAGIFELLLKLPDSTIIDSVDSTAMRSFRVDAASRRLIVTLNERRQGLVELQVTGHREIGGSSEVDLPLLEPIGIFREDGTVQAFIPEGIELSIDEAKLAGAHPEAPEQVNPPPGTRLAGTWSFHHRPVVLHSKTVRKPTRLSARIGTTVAVRQESTSVASRVEFLVENAPIDTFRISVPEIAADKVQFQAVDGGIGIKQQSRDEKAEGGWVAWTIVLERKVTGRQRFVAKYDLSAPGAASSRESAGEKATRPAAPGGDLPRAELSVLPPQVLGIKNTDRTDRVPIVQLDGEVAVQKEQSLSIAATASGGDVEPIDVRELKQLPPNAYLAYRYEKQPVAIKLSLVKYRVQEVVETVVDRALIEVVVDRDAGALYRCRYRIKSSQRQRLPLELPTGSNPLGVFLDGKPARLETAPQSSKGDAWTSYFVNLVRTKSSDEPLLLTVEFRRPVRPAPFETFGRPLKLDLPRIGGPTDHQVVVQQTRTAVWVPGRYALVQTPDGFLAESKTRPSVGHLGVTTAGPAASDLDQWIGGGAAGLEFPIQGNGYVYSRLGSSDSIQVTWVDMAIYTLVISLALAVIGWLLRRNRWEALATIVLAAALAATLGALLDRQLVWHILLAARYGLAALAVIWFLEAFRRIGRPAAGRKSPAAPGLPPGVVVPPPGIFDSLLAKER